MSVDKCAAIDRAIGAAVRERRVALGKTQQDLAWELGLSYQQVQKYETGANRISAGVLALIARELVCSPADFFAAAPLPGPLPHGGTLRSELGLVAAWRRIPPGEAKASLLRLIVVLGGGDFEERGAILAEAA